jgi:serine/threonine protein kinase
LKSFIQKLADFGLATVMKDNGQAGTIVGTPGYIAP